MRGQMEQEHSICSTFGGGLTNMQTYPFGSYQRPLRHFLLNNDIIVATICIRPELLSIHVRKLVQTYVTQALLQIMVVHKHKFNSS